ncbi:MAG: response regulator [Phycisphaerae bacterium]
MPLQPTSKHIERILLVRSARAADHAPDFLRDPDFVHGVHTLEDAVAALRSHRYDFVVAEAEFFPALLAAGDVLGGTALLEHADQGVAVVAADGRIIWANLQLRMQPGSTLEVVRDAVSEALREWEASGEQTPVSTRCRALVVEDRHFDLRVTPIVSKSSELRAGLGLLWDVTDSWRLEEQIDAIHAAGRELMRWEAQTIAEMDVAERMTLLEERIVHLCRDLLHFDHFTLRLIDPKTNRLDTVLGSLSEEAKAIPLYAATSGNGISGFVAATGQSYIAADVSKDPLYVAGLANARSSLTVPLRMNDRVIGVLNIESDRPAAFSQTDRRFAEIFANYISMAFHILQTLAAERHVTTGQLAADVSVELGTPLNEIVSQASRLAAQRPELAPALDAIVAQVERARASLRSVCEHAPIRGSGPSGDQVDPIIAGKRILIADDEDVIRETVSDVLTKCGARIVTARDGNEAASICLAQPFDLVMSDIKMPNKNGYEVFAAARSGSPNCHVVLITGFGYDPNHSIVRATKEGLAGVLFKPFKVEQLLETVRTALTPAK